MPLRESFDENEHENMVLECFRNLWSYSADLMFIMAVENDGEFSLYDSNPASRRSMGIGEDELVHRLQLRGRWDNDIVDGLYETYRKAIEAKKSISVEQFALLEGKEVWFDTLLVPIFDTSGNPIFICGVSRDISIVKHAEVMAVQANDKLKEYTSALESINQNLDIKVQERTEELENSKKVVEEALEAKSSFVARMSHEIRTPINAVIGLSNLALQSKNEKERQDCLHKILSSGDMLLGIVNDILDFSKMEMGKLSVESVPFSLEKIVSNAVNMSAFSAHDKPVEIISDISNRLPLSLLGDPFRIQQILVNLINNAIKFTDQGEVSIRVSGEELDDRDIRLLCEIEDSGIGLKKEQITRLFSSFNQADDTITRKYGGTGLGLAIVRQLCELMGGDVWVESELGKGSKFTISLLLKVPKEQPPSFSVSTKKDLNALIVDDNSTSRKVLINSLNYMGITCVETDSGAKALEAVVQSGQSISPFDVIFIDWKMPDMDGIQTAYKLQSLCQNTVPLVLMSSAHQLHQIQQCINSGLINSFIEKPISMSSLTSVINQIINNEPTILKNDISSKSSPRLDGFNILVVEDNLINQKVALGYLKHTRALIDCADNGELAIEMVKSKQYDLVLMDVQMPVMDGLTASKIIRGIKGKEALPIVAMTAHASDEDRLKSISAGMNEHITKPINSETLYRVIQQCLEQSDLDNDERDRLNNSSFLESSTEKKILLLNSIKALNVTKALEGIGHKKELYLELVESFWNQYKDIINQTSSELFDSKSDNLLNNVHSLKSNSVYIGACSIYKYSSELQETLIAGEKDEALLNNMVGDMKELLVSLKGFMHHNMENEL